MSKTINACVVARKGENIESLLKRFTLEMQKSDILKTIKEKEYYEKPSVKRRRKRMESKFNTD